MARAPKQTVRFSKRMYAHLARLSQPLVDDEFANMAGPRITEGILASIKAGRSPVAGYGPFAKYKDPKKYPGDQKPARPVNLTLTGEMLSELSFRVNAGGLEVGILPGAPNEVKVRARVHNTGEREDIPMRHFIPFKGEFFIGKIETLIRILFKKRIRQLMKD